MSPRECYPGEIVRVICPDCDRELQMRVDQTAEYECPCGWDAGLVIVHSAPS